MFIIIDNSQNLTKQELFRLQELQCLEDSMNISEKELQEYNKLLNKHWFGE